MRITEISHGLGRERPCVRRRAPRPHARRVPLLPTPLSFVQKVRDEAETPSADVRSVRPFALSEIARRRDDASEQERDTEPSVEVETPKWPKMTIDAAYERAVEVGLQLWAEGVAQIGYPPSHVLRPLESERRREQGDPCLQVEHLATESAEAPSARACLSRCSDPSLGS